MIVEWVKQEDRNGCGIACLAMVTSQTYQQVRADFVYFDNSTGIDPFVMDAYLADRGYAVARKYEKVQWNAKKHHPIARLLWPCDPFADVHICQVQVFIDPPTNHYVVMLRDRTVLDPTTPKPICIDAYSRIWNIAGIFRFQ